MQFVTLGKGELAKEGKMKGKLRTPATCCIMVRAADGTASKVCGKSMVIWRKSTTPIFYHLREMEGEPAHERALFIANSSSCNQSDRAS
mmetsp:Transcript_56820/g.100404  ORF Transcript_56820/g.100404 Transcript_56820/m.100404 type:complete len:89 (-) Transcript_56820:215-481(-)